MKCYVLYKKYWEVLDYDYAQYKKVMKVSFDKEKLLQFINHLVALSKETYPELIVDKFEFEDDIVTIRGYHKEGEEIFNYEITSHDFL